MPAATTQPRNHPPKDLYLFRYIFLSTSVLYSSILGSPLLTPPGARLSTRSYAVAVHSVSTDLDLSATPQIIADDNSLIPGPSSILGTRWLDERT